MHRSLLVAMLTLSLALAGLAQAPCSAVPLSFPLNFGDTSTSANIGGGLSDPYFPPALCSLYGDNDSREDWYVWTAPTDGWLTVTTCPGFLSGAFANFDSSLAIFEGPDCFGPLNFQSCNGDGPNIECPMFESVIIWFASAGQTYWIKVNGWATFSEGTYALAADFTPAAPSFALTFSGGAGLFSIDLSNGQPNAQYFTAASFDPANATFPGGGWWGGLHITFQDVLAQLAITAPPFRGNLDAQGAMSLTVPYPPALSGLSVYGVSFQFDGGGVFINQSAVAAFTF